MSRWRCLLAAFLAITISGCSAVYSTKPIGETPSRVKAEDWEGIWINKEASVSVKVIDGENGLIKAAWVEWKGNEAKLESYEIQLRQSEEWLFANVRIDDENGRVLYVWAPIKHHRDQLVGWLPDAENIRALGKNGKLPCKEEGANVILDGLTPDHMKIIASQTQGLLYDWQDPLVFIRVVK